MRFFTLAAVIALAGFMSVAAQNTTPSTTEPPQTASQGRSTLTGCLKGSTNQYYVIEKDGTEHVLLARKHDLSQYVNHEVVLNGQADVNRDASSSSDEGSAHGNRFFAVDSISDRGACKK